MPDGSGGIIEEYFGGSNSDGDGSILTSLLNGPEDSVAVNVSNPINWSRLGKAIGGTIVAMLSISIQAIFGSIAEAVNSVISGMRTFVVGIDPTYSSGGPVPGQDGLLDVTLGALVGVYKTVWDVSLAEYGAAGYPVAMLITLVSVGIMAVGVRRAIERLLGVS